MQNVEIRFETWQIPVVVYTLRQLAKYYREMVKIWPHDEFQRLYEDADGELHFPDDYADLAKDILEEEGVVKPQVLLLRVLDYLAVDPHQSPRAQQAWKDLRQVCYTALNDRIPLADWQVDVLCTTLGIRNNRAKNPLLVPVFRASPELSQALHKLYTNPNQSPQEREAWRLAYVRCNNLLLAVAPMTPQPRPKY